MLCYLLHQTPLWKGLPDGKRNVRIMFLALTFYTFFHAFTYEYKDTNLFCKIWQGYFIWIIAVDIFSCACLYKLYYGRTILKELNPREQDYFDNKTHTYYEYNKSVPLIQDIEQDNDNKYEQQNYQYQNEQYNNKNEQQDNDNKNEQQENNNVNKKDNIKNKIKIYENDNNYDNNNANNNEIPIYKK